MYINKSGGISKQTFLFEKKKLRGQEIYNSGVWIYIPDMQCRDRREKMMLTMKNAVPKPYPLSFLDRIISFTEKYIYNMNRYNSLVFLRPN